MFGDVFSDVGDAFSGVGEFFTALLDPETWRRIFYVLFGVLLVGMALHYGR